MKTAVLVIDVQHALCTGDEAAFDANGIIDRINKVTAKARAAGAPVVFIQHEQKGSPFEFGAEGWRLADGLRTHVDDLRVRKTTPDSFLRTNLHQLLQQHGIGNLIVCGLQSDFCVDSTTRGALAHGYAVTLVEDGHSTVDNGVLTAPQITAHHNRTLACTTSFGPRVTLVKAEQLAVEH